MLTIRLKGHQNSAVPVPVPVPHSVLIHKLLKHLEKQLKKPASKGSIAVQPGYIFPLLLFNLILHLQCIH